MAVKSPILPCKWVFIVALAWLMAQGPSVFPIPGTTQLPHLRDNIGATQLTFSDDELMALTAALDAIEVRGERAPPIVREWNGTEALDV